MDSLVIILLVSITGLVKSDDNVAMESETGYQVRVPPEFPMKVEQNYDFDKSNLQAFQSFGQKQNFEKNIKTKKYSINNNPTPTGQYSISKNNATPTGQYSISKNPTPTGEYSISNNPTPTGQYSKNNNPTPTGQYSISNNPTPTGQYSISNNPTPTGQYSISNNPTPTGQYSISKNPTPTGQYSINNNPTPTGQYSISKNNATPTGQYSISKNPTPTGQYSISNNPTPTGQYSISNNPTPTGQYSISNNPTPTGQYSISNNPTPTGQYSISNNPTPTGQYSKNNNPTAIHDNLNQKSKNEIPDNAGAASQQVILYQPHQLHQEPPVKYQVGALSDNPEYVYQNKKYAQEGYESGYSNTVHHSSDEEDFKSAINQGSVSDIKKIVPKSTVSFKMYHKEKSGNSKPGNLKSEFQSNVFHEVAEPVQQQSEDAAKPQVHVPNPVVESHHAAVYPATISPTQLTFAHSTAAVPSLPNNFVHQGQSGGLSKYLSKTAGNFRIVAANPNFEMYRHKINNPEKSQKIVVQNQGFTHQPNFFKHVQALHQFEDTLPESFTTTPTKVVELPSQNIHFEGDLEQPKLFGHSHLPEFKHLGKKNPKKFKSKKHWGQHKKAMSNHNIHQIQGQPESYSTMQGSQILHKMPAFGESFPIPVKHESSQKPSNNPALYASSVPLTPQEYMAKYQRDVALIQNSWKTFKQANFKVKENENLSPTILSKPPDTFHFEINPLIDMDKTLGQDNFDHQKALEGSTTFDLKHAIGMMNGNKELTAETMSFPDLVNGVKLSTFEKSTFPYSFPLTEKYHTIISQDHFPSDSLSSNSDLSQSSFSSVIPDNKFLYKFQNLPELNDKNNPLAKLVGSDFHDQLSSFNHQLKSQIPLESFPSELLSEHQKHNLFSGTLKPVREANFQQKKNNALFLENPQLIPFSNIDWDSPTVKLGKSKKIMIHSDLLPLMQEPGKKVIPILMKERRSHRSYKIPLSGVYVKFMKNRNSNRQDKLENEPDFDLMQVDSKKVVNKYKRNDKKNEYPVSAFYKIDKSSKISENKMRS